MESAPPGAVVGRGGWRPDIQGLRAVAVGLVVVYHAAPSWLPGGYVGVDVFFVISGFLITGLLVDELSSKGSIAFAAFYARRIRRLVPPAALVLIATLIAVKLVAPPLSLPGLARDAGASALYISNFRFALAGMNYLNSNGNGGVSPFLHYWSLGVEEQFYLVWPLLLLLAAFVFRRSLAGLAVVMGGVAIASLIVSVWLTDTQQPYAFFLLPARGWEFALGGLAALAVPRLRSLPARVAAATSWLGLGMVVVAGFAFGPTTPFPGYAALAPVLGTALVIAGGTARPAGGAGLLLRIRPFQAIGRVSYSLYLWHWPLIVLPMLYLGTTHPNLGARAFVLLSFPLAFLTYRLVESPSRRWPWLSTRSLRTYAVGALVTVAVIGTCAWVRTVPPLYVAQPYISWPGLKGALAATPAFVPSNLQPSLTAARWESPAIPAACDIYPFRATRNGSCFSGDLSSSRTIVLFGDSHAAQWYPAIADLARQQGWRLLTLVKSSCPSVDTPIWLPTLDRMFTECNTWRRLAFTRIRQAHPFAVILGNYQGDGIPGVSQANFDARWQAGLARTIAQLPRGSRAIVLADTPQFSVMPATCLSSHLQDVHACSLPADKALDLTQVRDERTVVRKTGAAFVDLTNDICPRGTCEPIHGNLLLYRDTNHLTTEFVFHLRSALDDAILADTAAVRRD